MVQPINYLAQMPQIDINKGFLESIQGAALLGQMQQRQQESRQKAIETQQAEQRLQAYRGEIENAYTQGTPDAFLRVMTLFPEHQKVIEPQWSALDKKRQQAEINQGSPVMSALFVGNAKVAKDLLQQRIAATPEGQDVSGLQSLVDAIDRDPKAATVQAIDMFSRIMAPDKFAETFSKMMEAKRAEEMAPITMRKEKALSAEAEEKAKQAAIKSRFAESEAVIDLEKKGWDIRKIQSDMAIAKQNAQIAAANVQIGKTTNDLKRQELELKVDEMKQKRDSAVREKAAEASTAAAQADNLLNTLETALQKAAKRDKTGKVVGYTRTVESATGPISTMLPTISQDVADFEELINTLRSQVTMSRIAEMKGTLSDKDMAVLESSLQSLSLRQSPQQLVNSLLESQRLTLKARKETIDKFGAPERLAQPDVPAARGAAAPETAIVGNKKYTRPENFTDAQWNAYKQSVGAR